VSKQNSVEKLMGTVMKRALFGSVLTVLVLFGAYFFTHKNFAPLTGQLQSLRGESSVKDGFYDLKIVGFDKTSGERLFADNYKDVQVKNAAYALNLNLPRKVSDSVVLQVCRSKQGSDQRDGSSGESEQTCTRDPRDGIEVVECAKTADISDGSGVVSRVLGIKEARVSIRCIDGATEKSIAAVERSNTTVLGAEAVAGLPGQPGVKGDKGDAGLPGVVGASGLQGAQGVSGLIGPQGPAGNPATDDQTLSYLSGTQILSITGGNSISLADLLDNTDVLASLSCSSGQVAQWSGMVWQCASAAVDTDQQTLVITGTGLARQLQITNGNTVNIPDANTDAQTLSLATNTLSISGGNSLSLAAYLDNTDSQNLAYNTGTQVLSIGGGNTVNLSTLLDNTDSQAISKAGNTLSITGNAGTVDLSSYLDNTDLLASLSCSTGQIAKWNGTVWACAADSNTTYTNGTGIGLAGNVFSNTGVLSVATGTGIANTGTASSPTLGLTASGVTAGTYNNVTVDTLGRATSGSNVAYLTTETDGIIGNEIVDVNTGSGLVRSGTGTSIDPYKVGLITSCTASQLLKYVASVWTCANDIDTTYTAGTGVSIVGTVISSSLGTDITSSEIVDGTITGADIASATVANTNLVNYSLSVNPGLGLNGGGAVSLGGTITLNSSLGDSIDTSEIDDGTILFADLAANGCSGGQIAGFDGTAWYCRGLLYYAESTNSPSTAPQAINGNSVAIGDGAAADGQNALAIGNASTILSVEGSSIGYGNNVKNDGLLALGSRNAINNANGIAVGRDNTVDGKDSAAFGQRNNDKGSDAVYLIGQDLTPTGSSQIVLGTSDSTKAILDNTGRFTFVGALAPGGVDGSSGQVLISQGSGVAPTWVNSGSLLASGTGISISGNTINSTLGTDITSSEIVDGTIVLADLAADSVNSSKIVDGTIVLADLAGNSVNSAKIVDGSVANADLVNSGLTVTAGTGLSGGGSVSLGGTVTLNSTLGADVTSSEIVDGTIAAADIAADALNYSELSDTLSLDASTVISLGTFDLITNLTSTGDFVIQDGGTAVFSVLDNGTFVFKNSANSTTGFSVQNATAVNLFVIDTTNNLVYVGDTIADSTGALLVLDTKNTAGDPVGVNGGQYYNSAKGKFRCFEAGAWTDCGEQQSRATYNYQNEMFGVPTTTDQNIASQVAGGGANNAATINSVAGHPGIVQSTTSVAAGGRSGLMTNAVSIILLGSNVEYVYESVVRLPVLSTITETYFYRTGFMDLNTGDPTDGCFFRYSNANNAGKWQGICRNNSTESSCDALITVTAAQWYRLTVDVNPAGTSSDFQIDGVSKCQVAANIPTGVGRGTGFGSNIIKTVGTVSNSAADVDYIQTLGRFATPR
jgi:hypothetical protein